VDTRWTPEIPARAPHMTVTVSVSPICVPVSTTGTSGPKSETCVPAFGHQEAFELINALVEWGWVIGCDGELLPPRWFRRDR
jgi:hypothetical protein